LFCLHRRIGRSSENSSSLLISVVEFYTIKLVPLVGIIGLAMPVLPLHAHQGLGLSPFVIDMASLKA
jgi:hypothetical protein